MLEKNSLKKSIKAIHCRRILNSHVEFTTEFVIELDDGTIGTGSTSQGETISIYERDGVSLGSSKVLETLRREDLLNVPFSQEEFDACLQQKAKAIGVKNCFALSLAFFDANQRSLVGLQSGSSTETKSNFPHICVNVLNGGQHAYTNPILSDFPEFLLVSKTCTPDEIIAEHNELQSRIRAKLANCEKVIVNGNVVNRLNSLDNRVWLDFLREITDDLNISSKYELMIDASAGDLWTGSRYKFSLTGHSLKTSSEMCDYWISLVDEYEIKFLEDPFHEKDFESWKTLTHSLQKCSIIGDNFYTSKSTKIAEGAKQGYTHGAIIKPDMAGTISETFKAIKTAKQNNQIIMTSHRSISTESTFLSLLTNAYNIRYIKIGPLATDYSSIIRLNELIRLSDIGYE